MYEKYLSIMNNEKKYISKGLYTTPLNGSYRFTNNTV